MNLNTFTPRQGPPAGIAIHQNAAGGNRPNAAPSPDTTERPGDQAAPAAPGAGENICPECSGTGKVNGHPCDQCKGTGKIVTGIGGG